MPTKFGIPNCEEFIGIYVTMAWFKVSIKGLPIAKLVQ